MKSKFRFRRLYKGSKFSIIGGIITTIGGLVINDLRREDSMIKSALNKIPLFKKKLIKEEDNNQEENNYRIISNSNEIKDQK